jgi:hypothetical protein
LGIVFLSSFEWGSLALCHAAICKLRSANPSKTQRLAGLRAGSRNHVLDLGCLNHQPEQALMEVQFPHSSLSPSWHLPIRAKMHLPREKKASRAQQTKEYAQYWGSVGGSEWLMAGLQILWPSRFF